MRTTVEISDRQRARLLRLAAQRGEKGFSAIVREAIDRYLEELDAGREATARAIATLGTLSDEAADALERSVRDLRARWR